MPEGDGVPRRMVLDQRVRDDLRFGAEATVGLLQRDHVAIDLAQDIQDAARIAAAIQPDALVHVVADDLDHRTLAPDRAATRDRRLQRQVAVTKPGSLATITDPG